MPAVEGMPLKCNPFTDLITAKTNKKKSISWRKKREEVGGRKEGKGN